MYSYPKLDRGDVIAEIRVSFVGPRRQGLRVRQRSQPTMHSSKAFARTRGLWRFQNDCSRTSSSRSCLDNARILKALMLFL